MDQKLLDFLIDVAYSPRKLKQFAKDPKAYLAKTKLSEEAKQAVLKGDADKIRELVGPGHKVECFAVIFDGNAKKKKKK